MKWDFADYLISILHFDIIIDLKYIFNVAILKYAHKFSFYKLILQQRAKHSVKVLYILNE